ncbi:MAG: hypothetical protein AAF554_18215 [Bacteroidota bacterium]
MGRPVETYKKEPRSIGAWLYAVVAGQRIVVLPSKKGRWRVMGITKAEACEMPTSHEAGERQLNTNQDFERPP